MFRGWVGSALALTWLLATVLHAQLSESDKKKRDAFLKAREEMHTISAPTPNESSTPAGKPKPAAKKGKHKHAKPAETPEPTKTPAKKRSPADRDEEDEAPRRAATPEGKSPPPRATALATPSPAPSNSSSQFNAPPADIVIQKSGLEEEQGYEPPPPPPPKRGFWSRVFGSRETNYRYLTSRVIDQLRRAPVQRSRWKFIIVHNSGTRQGNAKAFDYYHRRVRKMQNGLAYHFVVGNGTSSGNGEIEVGDRWRRQINGGHVHSDYLNNISLGICLVGDFNRERPTRAQMDATEELIRYLRERCGRVEGGAIPVRPHREMNPPQWSTDCPGDAFPYNWFRKF